MTKIVNDILVIEKEEEGVCDLCGVTAETRPYGPNKEEVCFECGMKHIETTKKHMTEVLNKTKGFIIN